MGTIYERAGVWWIRWLDSIGRRRSARFPSNDLAEEALAKNIREAAARRNRLPLDPRDVPTLKESAKKGLDARDKTHRSADQDRYRWKNHLAPFFEAMRPDEVDAAAIRRFVQAKLATLSSTSVGHCVRQLSAFFTDLVEDGYATANPVASVSKSTRRLYRNAHDPKDTPYLESREDIARVFRQLPEPYNVAFAIGVLGGLRTGEVIGLDWSHVDLDTGVIHVQQQVRDNKLGPLKDDESRDVPVMESLTPVLREWKLRTGGKGLLFRPKMTVGRGGGGAPGAKYMTGTPLNKAIRKAIKDLKILLRLPPSGRIMVWYSCTRHTFASHFVREGGSLEELAKILGHESTETTARYAHLSPRYFRPETRTRVSVDLSMPNGRVIPLPSRPEKGTASHAAVTDDTIEVPNTKAVG
jgi:integrase